MLRYSDSSVRANFVDGNSWLLCATGYGREDHYVHYNDAVNGCLLENYHRVHPAHVRGCSTDRLVVTLSNTLIRDYARLTRRCLLRRLLGDRVFSDLCQRLDFERSPQRIGQPGRSRTAMDSDAHPRLLGRLHAHYNTRARLARPAQSRSGMHS